MLVVVATETLDSCQNPLRPSVIMEIYNSTRNHDVWSTLAAVLELDRLKKVVTVCESCVAEN